jgi:hypothetical protein
MQSIISGIVIILFFQCIGALINPVNRTSGGIKWLLVIHTVAMFLFVTVFTALNLDISSTAFVDNRAFSGINGSTPGPIGYQYLSYSQPTGIISTVMFLLNNWLADGLLVSLAHDSITQVSEL